MKFSQKNILYLFLFLASIILFSSCASNQYHVAQQNKEKPWGKCVLETEVKLNKPLNIFKLKKVEANGSEKIWLEGHSSFLLNSSNEKWQVVIRSEREIKSSGSKCISSLDIRRGGILHSQVTNILLDCKRGLEVFSEFKSILRTSQGKWFPLNMNCSK